MAKVPPMPRRLFGNRVIIAVKPSVGGFIVKDGVLVPNREGEFGNPNFREAVIVMTGEGITEDLKPGDKVCWNSRGGVPYHGLLVVSVLDIEFVIPPNDKLSDSR
jgi:hypothetical protein